MSSLAALARLYGAQHSYHDFGGEPHDASDEALMATLSALGAPPAVGANGISDAINHRLAELRQRATPQVVPYWLGASNTMRLHLFPTQGEAPIEFELQLEDGGAQSWTIKPGSPMAPTTRKRPGGYGVLDVPLPSDVAAGYHTLYTELDGKRWQTLIIAAPPEAWQPGPPDHWWGTFLPLYALRSERPWQAGDYTDLRRLVEWTGELGGQMVGTLPLLAGSFDGDPSDYSPYSPVSRLAWNEFYLDVDAIPELTLAPAVRDLVASPAFRSTVSGLAEQRLVDYPAIHRLKRQALAGLAKAFFEGGASNRLEAFRRFLKENPLVSEYARFRAVGEQQGAGWQAWPEPQRSGLIIDGDYDPDVARYHEYVQWLAETQMAAAAPDHGAAGLYMDVPLGVHASGFDTWRFRDSFALNTSAGAPPDGIFISGQDWGFPPLHPQRLRDQGHRYFIEVVRQHMRHARALRIDHVMGLYRLYWIPNGFPANDGVYVRYPADELAAILCLESHRHRCVVVGENLGTVPAAVERMLQTHGFRPMDVTEFSATDDQNSPFVEPARAALASIGTHDTPSFAGWWYGLDIHDKLDLGLVNATQAEQEKADRAAIRTAIEAFVGSTEPDRNPDDPALARALAGTLRWLAGSRAWGVLVNLEDLLLELQPQNVPGTYRERPNWLRKASATLEAIMTDPAVMRTLTEVAKLRRQRRP